MPTPIDPRGAILDQIAQILKKHGTNTFSDISVDGDNKNSEMIFSYEGQEYVISSLMIGTL